MILTLFLQGELRSKYTLFSSPISQFVTHFLISYIEGFLVRFWISHYLKKKLK